MDARPIGIFDSGAGGLTAVRSLRALLPAEDLVFLADTARVPYGGRNRAELREIAASDLRFLASRGVKAVLAACGTVSSNCPEVVSGFAGGPSCGVVAEAARLAARVSSGRIGVLATEATARTGAFEREILRLRPGAEVTVRGTAELVPLVEAGRTGPDDPEAAAAVGRALAMFEGLGIDTLVLGCTHFPLLAGVFSAQAPGLRLIDSGRAGAEAIARLVSRAGIANDPAHAGRAEFFVSGGAEAFRRTAGIFLPGGAEGLSIFNAEIT